MSPSAFALESYLSRIETARPRATDLRALRDLHLAHRLAIPFENLDIQLGKPINLDIESVQQKLVHERRGGYCFEQNTLFKEALGAVGFEVEPCEARVRPPGGTSITPRTHMVLIVRLEGVDWLVDVGFGVSGPLEPVPLSDQPIEQLGWAYRVLPGDESLVLQTRDPSGWRDLYAFVPEPRYPVDFEVANWFTSTHPESRFVRTLTVQRVTREGRHVLHNLAYSYSTPAADPLTDTTREITRAELTRVLADTFGIEVPEDARFRAIDADG